MKYRVIDRCREAYPVRLMCRCLQVSTSGYYAWRHRPLRDRDRENERLLDRIRVLHAQSDGALGAPRIRDDLEEEGERVGLNRVARLMRLDGLKGILCKKRCKKKASGSRPHDVQNHLVRDFSASAPNTKWVTDITYVRIVGGQWLYLAVVVDPHSRLHAVYPETQGVMGDLNVQYDLNPYGASRMIVPLAQVSPRFPDQNSVNDGLKYMMSDAGMNRDDYDGDATGVRSAIQRAKRKRAARIGLDYGALADGQLTDSWATGIFPNVQIGLHPEGAFLMRSMPHATDPNRLYYHTMTLFRPADDENYTAPAWMGIPEGIDLTGALRPDTEHVPLGEPPNLGLVLDQDSEPLPVVQVGTRSRGFDGPLWGEQEKRLRHFHTEVDRYFNGER